MKTNEELNAIKAEVEDLSKKLAELTEDELKEVTGGVYCTHDMPGKEDHEKYIMKACGSIKSFIPILIAGNKKLGDLKKIDKDIDDGSSQE